MAEGFDLWHELTTTRAVQDGHFLLSSGLHSNRYVQCARLLEEPRRTSRVGTALARELEPHKIGSILSPAIGGLVIGYAAAAALNVRFRFTERKAGEMSIRRGFSLAPGERVAVVEDVVTTGGSAREAAAVAERAGAQIVAFGAIIDRSGEAQPFDRPFVSLGTLEVDTYTADDCPLCKAGEPIGSPGSRRSE